MKLALFAATANDPGVGAESASDRIALFNLRLSSPQMVGS
jgi:hypothetical protein